MVTIEWGKEYIIRIIMRNYFIYVYILYIILCNVPIIYVEPTEHKIINIISVPLGYII